MLKEEEDAFPSFLNALKRNRPLLYAKRLSLSTATYEIEESDPSILESRSSAEQYRFLKSSKKACITTNQVADPKVQPALHENNLRMEIVPNELKLRIF